MATIEEEVIKAFHKLLRVNVRLHKKERELATIKVKYGDAYAEYERAADLYVKEVD